MVLAYSTYRLHSALSLNYKESVIQRRYQGGHNLPLEVLVG